MNNFENTEDLGKNPTVCICDSPNFDMDLQKSKRVYCMNCGRCGPWADSEEKAIKKWDDMVHAVNTHVALGEELSDVIEELFEAEYFAGRFLAWVNGAENLSPKDIEPQACKIWDRYLKRGEE